MTQGTPGPLTQAQIQAELNTGGTAAPHVVGRDGHIYSRDSTTGVWSDTGVDTSPKGTITEGTPVLSADGQSEIGRYGPGGRIQYYPTPILKAEGNPFNTGNKQNDALLWETLQGHNAGFKVQIDANGVPSIVPAPLTAEQQATQATAQQTAANERARLGIEQTTATNTGSYQQSTIQDAQQKAVQEAQAAQAKAYQDFITSFQNYEQQQNFTDPNTVAAAERAQAELPYTMATAGSTADVNRTNAMAGMGRDAATAANDSMQYRASPEGLQALANSANYEQFLTRPAEFRTNYTPASFTTQAPDPYAAFQSGVGQAGGQITPYDTRLASIGSAPGSDIVAQMKAGLHGLRDPGMLLPTSGVPAVNVNASPTAEVGTKVGGQAVGAIGAPTLAVPSAPPAATAALVGQPGTIGAGITFPSPGNWQPYRMAQ